MVKIKDLFDFTKVGNTIIINDISMDTRTINTYCINDINMSIELEFMNKEEIVIHFGSIMQLDKAAELLYNDLTDIGIYL